ncbi:MAG: DJ-1/PfpI family protein [Halobacteriota archaeon]
MTAVCILVYDGFDELDAIAPFEVFQTAGAMGGDIASRLVTHEEPSRVVASHGLTVEVEDALPAPTAPDRPDLLVIPGGGWNDRTEDGAWAEAQRGDVPDVLTAYHDEGVTVASVCTGGMLLAAAGLTEGRSAVTHAGALDDLRESGATVVDARVVVDGDVLTAGGVTAGLDLALYLVERACGGDIAERVATELEYERRPDVHVV